MIRQLSSAAALTVLLSTAALAQAPNPPPPAQPAPPPMAAPAPKAEPAPMDHATGNVKILTSVPANGTTVTNYYKQSVYDPQDNKIGDVSDLIVEKDGKITAAMVGVGGFLGIGEKNVAVPFDSLKLTQKNNKWYLTLNATKDELKNAPGFKYDRNTTTWVPEKSASTEPKSRTARQ